MPVRRWLKRTSWITASLAALALGVPAPLARGLQKFSDGLCANQELASVTPPDGHRRALVFERDCGATTGFSTRIAILGTGERLGEASDPLFVADTNHGAAPSGPGGGPAVRVSWLDNTHIEVRHHPGARIFKAARREGDIEIVYHTDLP